MRKGLLAAPVALTILVFFTLGLYQSGYTGAEWDEIKAEARNDDRNDDGNDDRTNDRSLVQVVRDRDGPVGLFRLAWQTNSDERLYGEYASLVLRGVADVSYIRDKQYADFELPKTPPPWRPYRDVRVEYPPVSLLAMSLPGIVSLSPWGYRFALGVLNLALLLMSLGFVSRLAGPRVTGRALIRRAAWMVALLGILVVTRIDLVSTCLLLAAMAAFQSERWTLSGTLIALGFLGKLFPGLFGLVGLYALLRDRKLAAGLKFTMGSLGTLGLILAVGWWYSDGELLNTFTYHGARGIQIESTYAALLLPLHLLLDLGVTLDLSFGSSNLGTSWNDWVRFAWPAILLALTVPVFVQLHRGRIAVFAATGAVLTAFVLSNKVFSPQYLLWLFPFVFAAEGPQRRRTIAFLFACALSQALYPRGYDLLKAFHPVAVAVLFVRNGLVAYLYLSFLRAGSPRRLVAST